MPSVEEDIRAYLAQLEDPEFDRGRIGERVETAAPEFESILKGIESRLNLQGLFSASPVTRSKFRAASEFRRGITSDVFGEISQERTALFPVAGGLEQQRLGREQQGRFGIGKFIGTGLGMLPFIPGIGKVPMWLFNLLKGGGGDTAGGGFESGFDPSILRYLARTGGLNAFQGGGR